MKKDLIKIDGENYKTEAFLINDYHPAIGNMLIIDGVKYVLIDNIGEPGRYVRAFTQDDIDKIKEYDKALNIISERLKNKVDISRIIKENLKDKSLNELKVGLQILKNEDEGLEVTGDNEKGCYHFKMYSGDLAFDFCLATCDDYRRESQDEFEENIKNLRIR